MAPSLQQNNIESIRSYPQPHKLHQRLKPTTLNINSNKTNNNNNNISNNVNNNIIFSNNNCNNLRDVVNNTNSIIINRNNNNSIIRDSNNSSCFNNSCYISSSTSSEHNNKTTTTTTTKNNTFAKHNKRNINNTNKHVSALLNPFGNNLSADSLRSNNQNRNCTQENCRISRAFLDNDYENSSNIYCAMKILKDASSKTDYKNSKYDKKTCHRDATIITNTNESIAANFVDITERSNSSGYLSDANDHERLWHSKFDSGEIFTGTPLSTPLNVSAVADQCCNNKKVEATNKSYVNVSAISATLLSKSNRLKKLTNGLGMKNNLFEEQTNTNGHYYQQLSPQLHCPRPQHFRKEEYNLVEIPLNSPPLVEKRQKNVIQTNNECVASIQSLSGGSRTMDFAGLERKLYQLPRSFLTDRHQIELESIQECSNQYKMFPKMGKTILMKRSFLPNLFKNLPLKQLIKTIEDRPPSVRFDRSRSLKSSGDPGHLQEENLTIRNVFESDESNFPNFAHQSSENIDSDKNEDQDGDSNDSRDDYNDVQNIFESGKCSGERGDDDGDDRVEAEGEEEEENTYCKIEIPKRNALLKKNNYEMNRNVTSSATSQSTSSTHLYHQRIHNHSSSQQDHYHNQRNISKYKNLAYSKKETKKSGDYEKLVINKQRYSSGEKSKYSLVRETRYAPLRDDTHISTDQPSLSGPADENNVVDHDDQTTSIPNAS
ncbi:hypothetical protein HELRODRAFT_170341 [Helobdella robusta]|uniref:Uncharacterized protein n=1 Tax=Helobdella robusta TaxID=6412 RepID=T1F2Y0_HELRO|nr:hypothetical protein HELRODRAFT_170341 [Helobdella robusta]ESO07788.1 hypothetical protein HELRODRAFT_170341 [Helobdella robusta]